MTLESGHRNGNIGYPYGWELVLLGAIVVVRVLIALTVDEVLFVYAIAIFVPFLVLVAGLMRFLYRLMLFPDLSGGFTHKFVYGVVYLLFICALTLYSFAMMTVATTKVALWGGWSVEKELVAMVRGFFD